MSKYAGHLLAILLGITITAAFYEGRRLIRNTSKAWTAAQTQVAGKEGPTNARRQALLKALEEEKGTERVAQIRQQRGTREDIRPRQGGGSQLKGARNVLQSRKTTLKDLPQEQRDAIRERRKRRRERIQEDLTRTKQRAPRAEHDAAGAEEEQQEEFADKENEEIFDDTALEYEPK